MQSDMKWTALVPIKQGSDGKSRLGAALAEDSRAALTARMADHVLKVLGKCDLIAETVILSPAPHEYPHARWAKDGGRGLNPEIARFREQFGAGPLLIIHADLPLLGVADVTALLEAAKHSGAALASDRAGEGTNALALADGRAFQFRFGPDSRALHCAQDPAMPVLQEAGLSADLDTPDDLEFLRRQGYRA